MLGFLDKLVEWRRPAKDQQSLVYRDELSKKPLINREKERERRRKNKNGVRVKILMTKEEAERLLSKCKEGGTLAFRDVVNEMMSIPVDRVRVVDPTELRTIPEED